ncbi:hypothetical protein OG698_10490 [Streptomyces sp. NBC_01003]|uniref:hypothetical protein n=1 Tax=Streptomyces sp. NBC_01003 TaxID=2903714 RepID=UPI003864B279|nr:hypothetical protein OG698_10490 [Streptomyces sp. NBC_01003]
MSILVRAAEREDVPALVRLRLANAERHAAFAGLIGMEAIAYAWDLDQPHRRGHASRSSS